MLRIINSPRSKRFYQLSFEGFRPKGKNKIQNLLKLATEFTRFVFFYILKKFKQALVLFGKAVVGSERGVKFAKAYLTRKLIWSRGRLGRPIANLIVMGVALVVFAFGEVFNSSRFVNSQEINPDYLQNVTDIIPKKAITTTKVPESRKRAEAFTYTVEGGDTLSSIGAKFKISTDAVQYVNGLTDSSILKVGQELTIPPISGLIHTVEDGDSLSSIAEKYDVPPQAIADFNYILDTSTLAVGTELVIPDAKVPEPEIVPVVPTTFTLPSYQSAPRLSGGWCIWPTTSSIVTQYFTWYHNGIDIATPWGLAMPPIFACSGGTVVRAGWDPWGLGLMVQIDHGNGYSTIYGHMSRIDVGYGQHVSQGQAIGVMGTTGRSTGPHVHFTVNRNGVPINPYDAL